MSATNFLKSASVAAITLAGLTLTACASGSSSGRYATAQSGQHGIYNYEGGRAVNCQVQPCTGVAPYGAVVNAPVAPPVYQHGGYATQTVPAPSYTTQTVTSGTSAIYGSAPQVVTTPSYTTTTTSVSSMTADCPAGTTPSGDGTCMESSTSYSSTGYTTSSTSYGSMTGDCPAGTAAQADGTCMQSGSTSYSSGTSYGSSTISAADCPAGTTLQSDNTCASGSSTVYTGPSVDIYSGSTSTNYGSSTSGYTGGSSVYLPMRK